MIRDRILSPDVLFSVIRDRILSSDVLFSVIRDRILSSDVHQFVRLFDPWIG